MSTKQIKVALEIVKFYAKHKRQLETQKAGLWKEQFLKVMNVRQEWQKLKKYLGLHCEETEQWLERSEWKIGQKVLQEMAQNGVRSQLKRSLHSLNFKYETTEENLVKKGLIRVLRRMQENEILRGIEHSLVQWNAILARDSLYGIGMDERVVELPLAIEVIRHQQGGNILDAGAALNLPLLKRLEPPLRCHMVYVTQSGYKEAPLFQGSQYSYVFGDLREMIFKNNSFDHVMCISTLEHIGMDNSRYGGARECDPDSYLAALREMYRVLKPFGVLMLTVPFGAYANHGWFQVFSHQHIKEMIKTIGAPIHEIKFYKHEGSWFELVEEDQTECADQHVVPSDSVDQIAVAKIHKTG